MQPPIYDPDLSGDQLAVLREAYVIATKSLEDGGQMSVRRGRSVAKEILELMHRGVDDPHLLARRSIVRSL